MFLALLQMLPDLPKGIGMGLRANPRSNSSTILGPYPRMERLYANVTPIRLILTFSMLLLINPTNLRDDRFIFAGGSPRYAGNLFVNNSDFPTKP